MPSQLKKKREHFRFDKNILPTIRPTLRVKIGEVEYRNPVFIGSTPATGSLEQFRKLWREGAGAIIVKTVMDDAQKGENNRRAIWTEDKTSAFNQGSTAQEMPPLEVAIKDMDIAVKEGIQLIPSIGSKKIYTSKELNSDALRKTLHRINGILGDPYLLFDEIDYERFNGMDELSYFQSRLYGMINLDTINNMLHKIAMLPKPINVEINFRYYFRSLEQLNMSPAIFAEKEEFDKESIINEFGNEYYQYGFRPVKAKGKTKFKYAFLNQGTVRKEALHRSLFAVNNLAKRHGIGLIAKFPFRSDIIELCATCEFAGYKGITLINTIKTPPRIEFFFGNNFPAINKSAEMQLSGESIRELSRSALFKTYSYGLRIPILSSGGVAMDLIKKNSLFDTVLNVIDTESEEKFEWISTFLQTEELGNPPESDAELNALIKNVRTHFDKLKRRLAEDTDVAQLTQELNRLRRRVNIIRAVKDVWDRILIGASAVQLSTAILGPDYYKDPHDQQAKGAVQLLVKGIQEHIEKIQDAFYGYFSLQLMEFSTKKLFHREGIDKFLSNATDNFIGIFKEEFGSFLPMVEKLYNQKIERYVQNHICPEPIVDEKTLDKLIKAEKDGENIEHPYRDYMIAIAKVETDLESLTRTKLMNKYGVDFFRELLELSTDDVFGIGTVFVANNEFTPLVAIYDKERCVKKEKEEKKEAKYCRGLCYSTRYCEAITPIYTNNAFDGIEINTDLCSGCGTCYQFCENDAINMSPRSDSKE